MNCQHYGSDNALGWQFIFLDTVVVVVVAVLVLVLVVLVVPVVLVVLVVLALAFNNPRRILAGSHQVSADSHQFL